MNKNLMKDHSPHADTASHNPSPHTNADAGRPLVSLVTLGCKLNHAETDSIATELVSRGFQVTQKLSLRADYTVINTCTVTAKADRKSRNSIYRALRTAGALSLSPTTSTETLDISRTEENEHTHPLHAHEVRKKKGVVIVTGCFVGGNKKEIEGMQVDYVIDNRKKTYIPDIIEAHQQKQILDIDALEENYFNYTPAHTHFHVRNNLKIQDGCDNFCTFCIIPMVRGKAQSRPLEDVVQDARVMLEHDTKEIVLTGVNMSRYDHEGRRFSDVLESLLKLDYKFRVRISSLEPDQIDDKFFDLLQHEKMCPHLHLCLQSGSERILMQMRRMYSVKEFVSCIEKIKTHVPSINLTSDVIVGFPTESDKDFLDTKKVVEHCAFSHIHIFPYSDRTGTRASRMQESIATAVKKERIHVLEDINHAQKQQYRLSLKNASHTVLVEKFSTSSEQVVASGLSEYYIPIDISSQRNPSLSSSQVAKMKNSMIPVTIDGHYYQDKEIIMQGVL